MPVEPGAVPWWPAVCSRIGREFLPGSIVVERPSGKCLPCYFSFLGHFSDIVRRLACSAPAESTRASPQRGTDALTVRCLSDLNATTHFIAILLCAPRCISGEVWLSHIMPLTQFRFDRVSRTPFRLRSTSGLLRFSPRPLDVPLRSQCVLRPAARHQRQTCHWIRWITHAQLCCIYRSQRCRVRPSGHQAPSYKLGRRQRQLARVDSCPSERRPR